MFAVHPLLCRVSAFKECVFPFVSERFCAEENDFHRGGSIVISWHLVSIYYDARRGGVRGLL